MAYLNTPHDPALQLCLAALADPTRRAVFHQLRRGPLTVGEIADEVPVSRPAVSQHLRALQQASLVHDRWEGRRHYFSINAATIVELRRYFEQMWQEAMRAYSKHVEDEEAIHGKSGRKSKKRRR
jgi:DNA-binding transcriptional ArsR family regulator